MSGSLDGRHVLVTGGASGIGKACAERYRAEGATVYVTDISPSSSDQIRLDVSSSEEWEQVIASLPPLDVVHLNAGITTQGRAPDGGSAIPLSDVSDDAYRQIVGVNLDGVFFGVRAVLPGMIQAGGGDIVVTASMAGLAGMPGDVAYTATKHAVVGLVKSLGASLGEHGVCISALCPGFVDTPLVPADAQQFISEMGLPVIPPSQVAEAAVQAIAERVNGSQWMVWGDTIRRFEQPDFGLQ